MKYRAIYKNTTIDPPGTIAHAKQMGVEMIMPKQTFFQLVHYNGIPNRFARFCCRHLKEYKVLDKAVIGVRRSESTARSKNYQEPVECKYYGKAKTPANHVQAIYPILEWTDEDVKEFIEDRQITCAPIYYDANGTFHVEERLGCMCCPLKYYKKRIRDFEKYPGMVKAYIIAASKYRETHPSTKTTLAYKDVYEWFTREIFFERQFQWEEHKQSNPNQNYKQFLEEHFGINL